jgi:hypothetical protein
MNQKDVTDWAAETQERWMIAKDHPGQERKNCVNITQSISQNYLNNLYDRYRNIQRTAYLLRGRSALIDHSGAVMFSCGYYQGTEIAELRWEYAENWNKKCRGYITSHSIPWDSMMKIITTANDPNLLSNCTYKSVPAAHYLRVFVITATLDANFHHLIADELGRLPRYLAYLKRNPDIMVHIRVWEVYLMYTYISLVL